jgi:aminomuconate-semialdehyde/2-hydroxymuconate-6-semialdehyde dehydrogenase
MKKLANEIGGKKLAPMSEAYLDNFDPSTGEVYSKVPDSDARDIELAVEAAERAFPAWAAMPSSERARILRRIAERIAAQLEPLARAESIDNGKPVALALRMDIPRSAQNFEFFADAATQFSTECHAGETLNYTLRTPLGVVGCISPWNLPLYLLTWKIAPALAAGNTVVAKPSEVTPMTAALLMDICREAGLPAGVLNLVHGLGAKAGAALCAHPRIKAISFTGSTLTGAAIAREAAPAFKKVSLEMGGKNPFIVFADADLDAAVESALRSAFTNQGEICLCGSRMLIERSIYPAFRDRLVAKARALRVGDPLDEKTDQGALVSRPHYEKVLSYLELARQEGGKILCGGAPAKVAGRCSQGLFIEPTLIEGLGSECRTNQEEIFGPVATLMPFDREEDALAWANSTRYGLAATLWTSNLSRAHRVSAALQSGIVWVNTWMARDLRTPFGGVKDSGVGREGGWDAMRFFTEPKNVCIGLEGAK